MFSKLFCAHLFYTFQSFLAHLNILYHLLLLRPFSKNVGALFRQILLDFSQTRCLLYFTFSLHLRTLPAHFIVFPFLSDEKTLLPQDVPRFSFI